MPPGRVGRTDDDDGELTLGPRAGLGGALMPVPGSTTTGAKTLRGAVVCLLLSAVAAAAAAVLTAASAAADLGWCKEEGSGCEGVADKEGMLAVNRTAGMTSADEADAGCLTGEDWTGGTPSGGADA